MVSDCASGAGALWVEDVAGSRDKEGKSCCSIEAFTGLDERMRKSKEACLELRRRGVGKGRLLPLDDEEEGEDKAEGGSADTKDSEFVKIAGRDGAGAWICGVWDEGGGKDSGRGLGERLTEKSSADAGVMSKELEDERKMAEEAVLGASLLAARCDVTLAHRELWTAGEH
ncbi:hypothetical protein ID866_3640 [Astraeus odoratus]|nr:hypothetical protein ID866_3640 [Astraeus odoratus]